MDERDDIRLINGGLPLIRLSFDAPSNLDGSLTTFIDRWASPEPNIEEVLVHRAAVREKVKKALSNMTERERQVIILQSRGLSNPKIGEMLGLTRERVRQIGENARMAALNLERRNKEVGKYQKKVCVVCRKSLAKRRDGCMFCSDKCRHYHFQQRRREDASNIL